MLLVSPKYGCSEEILSIVSLLSVPMVFQRPPDSKKAADAAKAQFQDRHSDHCTLLTAYNAWVESGRSPDFCYDNFLSSRALKQAENVRKQLERVCRRTNTTLCSAPSSSASYWANIRKALCAGYFMQIAHQQRAGGYLTGKYSKRRRSNVAVIIVRIVFLSAFLFYCLLCSHSFPNKPKQDN